MTSEFSCQNSVSLSLLHSVLQGQICLLFQVSLEKEMATHSSILAWRIPWTEELGGLQSTGRKESDTTERPGISWLPTLAFWFLIMERTSFGVLVLEDLVGLHRNVQLQLLQHNGWGKDLDYHDDKWFASEVSWDHSVIFQTAPDYCISDSFVNYEGYSISSQGFLCTVVDIMVIWIKFTCSSLF